MDTIREEFMYKKFIKISLSIFIYGFLGIMLPLENGRCAIIQPEVVHDQNASNQLREEMNCLARPVTDNGKVKVRFKCIAKWAPRIGGGDPSDIELRPKRDLTCKTRNDGDLDCTRYSCKVSWNGTGGNFSDYYLRCERKKR